MQVVNRARWRFRGKVYPDGSCQPHVLSELAGAGCGAAMLGEDGDCIALASGTVPSCLETSVAAEWCAASIVVQLAVDKVDGAQDCKAVVNEWAKPLAQRLRTSSVHAGQSMALLGYETAKLVSLRWIRGHVEEAVTSSTGERTDARGNNAADAAANDGRLRYPASSEWLNSKVAREVQDAQAVIVYAAEVLPLWPIGPWHLKRSSLLLGAQLAGVCDGRPARCTAGCFSATAGNAGAAWRQPSRQRRSAEGRWRNEEYPGDVAAVLVAEPRGASADDRGCRWGAMPFLRGFWRVLHSQAQTLALRLPWPACSAASGRCGPR